LIKRAEVFNNINRAQAKLFPELLQLFRFFRAEKLNTLNDIILLLTCGRIPSGNYRIVYTIRQKLLLILQAGKDVVTANKALLAEHGSELFAAALYLSSADGKNLRRGVLILLPQSRSI